MNRRHEKGFSLMELLIAMMIIAVLGTLGFNQVKKRTAQARYLKAQDDLKIVAEGLDQYYLAHGKYPDFGSYEAMVDANSLLVKGNLIKPNMGGMDPFGAPYEGKSNRGTYELKCQGDPNDPEEHGPIVRTPSQVSQGGAGADKPKADAGAPK